MKNKVIVLGCRNAGLAIIRSLAKRGLHVIALSHNPNDIGLVSKYVDEALICPDSSDLDAFQKFMIEKASLWSGSLIIETADSYAEALSKLKPELSKHYVLTTPDWDVLSLVMEKENTYKLAEECGVPSPKTYYPESLEHLKQMEPEISLPCIIKPTQSHEFVARFGKKLFVVQTFDELLEKYGRCVDENLPVILQEIVPGDDTTYERIHIYLNSKGEPSAQIYHKTLRLNPPKYGVMRVGITVPPLSEAGELASRLLKHMGYNTGVACFQFKRHEKTGELILIEINGRIPRSVQIDIAAGVDFPWVIYQDMIKDVQTEVQPYKETYYIEFWPDLFNALARDDKKQFSLRKFLAPYFSRNKTFATFSWSDLKPFIKQTMLLPKVVSNRIKVKHPDL